MKTSGSDSLIQALEGIEFPIQKDELIDCFGKNEVVVNGRKTDVESIVSICPHETYNSMDDILKCPAIEPKLKAA